MSKFKDHTGDVNYNSQGLRMTILEYRGVRNVDVSFEDGSLIKNCSYSNFKKGIINSYLYPSVCGVGYIGYDHRNENLRIKKSYQSWVYMLKRCYIKNAKNRVYQNCKVCDEWLCYLNYEKWFDENYYYIDNSQMNLDKDILIKGNKIYCPNACVFVPQNINKLFTKSNKTRGNLPIGVYKVQNGNKYAAHLNINNRLVNLGSFNTVEEAFAAYKVAKENEVKRVADEYKDKIPQKLYEAMYKYKVEITD